MNKLIDKIPSNNCLYLLAYCIICFCALCGGSSLIELPSIIKFMLYCICVLLFFIIIIRNKINFKKMFIILSLCIITVFSFFELRTIFLLMNILAIIAIKNINFKNIVKIDAFVKLIFLILHLLLYCKDYIFDFSLIEQSIIYKNEYIRHSIYFTHPNIFSSIVFWLIVDFIYIKGKVNWKQLIVYTILIVLTFVLTKTRMMLILYIIMVLLLIITHFMIKNNVFKKIIDFVYKYIFEMFTIVSILLVVLFNNNYSFFSGKINELMSGRIYSSLIAIQQSGIHFFSSGYLNDSNLLVDNFYIRCIVIYGIFYLLLMFLLTKSNKHKGELVFEKSLIIVFAASLFVEYNGFIIGNSVILLLLGKLFFSNSLLKKNYKIKQNSQNKKLSVIVPVYNVEPYIEKCILSILNQSYRNLELILIDDGSTDESGLICDSYAKIDSRVVVKHIKNQGVSNARNTGIDMASGEYLGFVDPDDYIDENMYLILINNLEEGKCDISICGNTQISIDDKLLSSTVCGEKYIISSIECLEDILDEKKYHCCCWNKVYRKNVLKNLRFQKKLTIAEDLDLIFRMFTNDYKVIYDSTPCYNWLIRSNSVTHEKFAKSIEKWNAEIELCESIIKECQKNIPSLIDYAMKRYIRVNMFCYENALVYELDASVREKYKKNILRFNKEILKSTYINLKFKLKLLILIYIPNLLLMRRKMK